MRNASDENGGRARIDAVLMDPLPGFVPRERQKRQIEQAQADQDMALFLKAASES